MVQVFILKVGKIFHDLLISGQKHKKTGTPRVCGRQWEQTIKLLKKVHTKLR